MTAAASQTCRACGSGPLRTFVDLGSTPLANSYLLEADLEKPEPSYPLHARVCASCFLVQVEPAVPPEAIFGEYAYFSSYSTSWVEHARRYAEAAIARLGIGPGHTVVEVASNDGYLLRHFLEAGIPVLGIEPAANVAEIAVAAGIPTEVRFFGKETAEVLRERGISADLVAANNVIAHVPDLNDFVAGFPILLSQDGVLTTEFPHLLRLIEGVQFDTIYHEHFSYFSFLSVERLFERHGLRVFDVERLDTHGGSLRIWSHRADGAERGATRAIAELRAEERHARLDAPGGYTGFAARVDAVKAGLLEFLQRAKSEGRSVVAYGAAAKGNTLLNACAIGVDLIEYVVDRSPHKQGRFLPGSRLPIHAPDRLFDTRPDYVLILPWNLKDEITGEVPGVREWGGRFVVPIPEVVILP